MNKDKSIKLKTIITILIGICSVILYIYILNHGQNTMVMRQFQDEMAQDIQSLRENYPNASKRHEYIQSSFDDIYQQNLSFIDNIIRDWYISDPEMDLSWDVLLENDELYSKLLASFSGFNLDDLLIVDSKGNIELSFGFIYSDFKDEIYKPLLATIDTDTPTSLRLLTEEDACLKYADKSDDYYSRDNYYRFENKLDNNDKTKAVSLYACPFPLLSDHALIIAVPAIDETFLESNSDAWTVLLQNEIIGEQGYVFVWSDETGKILYHPDQSLKYQDVGDLGMDMDLIQDGKYGWNTINGQKMYMYPVHDKELGVWITCAVSQSEMISSRRGIMLIQWIMFIMLAAALVYYTVMLLRQNKIHIVADFMGTGKATAHLNRKYKLLIVTVLISISMLLFSFYLQTLYLMSSWAESSVQQTERIKSTVSFNKEQAEQYKTLYESKKNTQLSVLGEHLCETKDNWSQDSLSVYSSFFNLYNCQILGKNGKSILAMDPFTYLNDSYEYDRRSETYENQNVDYIQETANQDEGKTLNNWMSDGRRVIRPITDYVEDVSNYLYVRYYSEDVDLALQSFSLSSTLDMARPGINGFVFTIDKENHTFTYYPEADMIGEDALNYGITENQIKINYCDYITVDNATYYATTDRIDNNIIYFVVLKENLLRQRFVLSVTAVIMALILFLMIGIMIYFSQDKIEMVSPDSEKRSNRDESQSAEYRIMQVFKYYIAFAATVIAVYTVLPGSSNYINVFGYVLEGNWERDINVFALTASIIIMCRGGIILYIAYRLISKVAAILPVRTGTILKMLTSLFNYITIGFLLYQCMLCFGLNPTALMASTGIVAVILGIGANSLVGDILAGIFLLMEGNIQIGDVILVSGFRGYVMELGIRMTKLFDMETEDIKFVPNNEVRNFVHMSMRRAVVFNEFQIRYEETLEDVERIIREELKHVKNKSPYILDGPFYLGVSQLGDNGVSLKTSTRCFEEHRKKVEREVNHIVYSIFQKYNIDVPYPQVTLHTGDDTRVVRDFPEE